MGAVGVAKQKYWLVDGVDHDGDVREFIFDAVSFGSIGFPTASARHGIYSVMRRQKILH
jgi:hypothetical protein